MKREIKFRALSMCKGERWVYGDLRHYARNPHTEKWTIHDPATGLETDIDETTIGQFTGLYDKNGKEIYEGDIVRKRDLTFSLRYEGVVVYNSDIGCFRIHSENNGITMRMGFEASDVYNDGKCVIPCKYDYEVIGNIHDNKDLL